jgi:hypothetical protein
VDFLKKTELMAEGDEPESIADAVKAAGRGLMLVAVVSGMAAWPAAATPAAAAAAAPGHPDSKILSYTAPATPAASTRKARKRANLIDFVRES